MSVRKVVHCILVNCGVVLVNGVDSNVVAISNLCCRDVVHVLAVPCLGPELLEFLPCYFMVRDFPPFLVFVGEEACTENCSSPDLIISLLVTGFCSSA